jgi:hypothetical protein
VYVDELKKGNVAKRERLDRKKMEMRHYVKIASGKKYEKKKCRM